MNTSRIISIASEVSSSQQKPEVIPDRKRKCIHCGRIVPRWFGTTKVDGKVKGDVDFDDVEDKVAFITPVPGGVGPMTIAYLFENVLEVYKKKNKIQSA